MKKLAFILKWISILFLIRVLYLIGSQIQKALFYSPVLEEKLIFGIKLETELTKSEYLILSTVIVLALLWLSYYVYIFIKISLEIQANAIFTKTNSIKLATTAKGVLVFVVALVAIELILNITALYESIISVKSMNYSIGYVTGSILAIILFKRLPFFVITIFILVIARLIEKGFVLKQENDLTI